MRWAQFVASPGRLHCWIAPPQRQHRPLIRRFHTRCLNRPRRPFHREVRGRCSGQEFIEPFEEHDRPEGLRVSKRRRPCHRRTLRCPRICAVSRTGRIAPLNLSGLTAAQNVAIGRVSRVPPVQTAMRNCTRDEGGPFEIGNQVLVSSHRKLLWSKAMVVSVAETAGQDPVR
jgi:hypothetical protein